MAKKKLAPGDRIQAPFDKWMATGIVNYVHGDYVHVSLDIDDTDEPVSGLYRADQVVPLEETA